MPNDTITMESKTKCTREEWNYTEWLLGNHKSYDPLPVHFYVLLRLNVGGTPRSAKGTKTLELSFSAFFNYSVLQYTIPLTSKLISFWVILVNLSCSHTLILNGYFFLNCGILSGASLLHTVYILLVFSSLSPIYSLLSLLHFLFKVNSNKDAHIFTTDRYGWACQLVDLGRSHICC